MPITGFTIDGDATGLWITLENGPRGGDIDSISQVEKKNGHWVIRPIRSTRRETILADAGVPLLELLTPALVVLLSEEG
jgi:hypothetical protein